MITLLFKILFINIILLFFIFSKDVKINDNSYNLIVSDYKYGLIEWEIENVFDKWINKLSGVFYEKPNISEINIIENYFYSKSDIDSVEFSKNQNQI